MGRKKKAINLPMAIFLAILSLIDVDIFITPKITVLRFGLISIVPWVLLSFFSLVMGFIFAELTYLHPKSGGIYEFNKQAFGSFVGFITAWIIVFSYWTQIAMYSDVLADILAKYTGINPLIWLFITLSIFHFLVFLGLRESTRATTAFSILSLVSIFALIYLSAITISKSSFPVKIEYISPYSFLTAMYLAMFSYAGWEGMGFLSEEVDNAKKNVPIAIMIGTFASTTILMILAVLLSVIYYAFGDFSFLGRLGTVLDTTMLVLLAGSVLFYIIAVPQLLATLARDGLLPEIFGRKHPKTGTPYFSIVLQYIMVLFYSFMGSFELNLEIVNLLFAIMYILTIISYLKLTWKSSERLFPKYFSISFAVFALSILFLLLVGTPNRMYFLYSSFIVLMAIPLYLSKALSQNKKIVIIVHDISARFFDLLARILIKEEIIRDILEYLDESNPKAILDFGCATGILTIPLAKKFKQAKIYASDIAPAMLKILRRKLKKNSIDNVILLLDEPDTIREDLYDKLDAIVSIGVLGYIREYEKVIKQISKALKKNGLFFFVEFDNVLEIFDMPSWLKDTKKLKELFRKYGLELEIKRIKGRLWDTVYFYGKKIL